jgi:hypothetical protein
MITYGIVNKLTGCYLTNDHEQRESAFRSDRLVFYDKEIVTNYINSMVDSNSWKIIKGKEFPYGRSIDIEWEIEKRKMPEITRCLTLKNNDWFCRFFYSKGLYFGYVFDKGNFFDMELSHSRKDVQNWLEEKYLKTFDKAKGQ